MDKRRSSEFGPPLALMREQIAASDLLPEAYASYRPLLADGLRYFLERLSPARLRPIFIEQSTLPASASTAQRLVTFLHHVPALHKLGQVVARERRLTPSFRAWLQQLESLEPRTHLRQVSGQLEKELPAWRKVGIRLEATPLAEGSVAVVMPFLWKRTKGVFKLLKRGIQQLLEEDLEILTNLGQFLDEDCHRYHLPNLDYAETFDTIRELLLHEVRLEVEQRHLAETAELYADMREVAIPRLLPFCTPRLTAMERINGEKITACLRDASDAPEATARTLAQALIARPLFSSREVALFHADPHAGNLLLTPDDRIGILDWSLAVRLHKRHRIQLVQLLLGALTLDINKMAQAIEALAVRRPDQAMLQETLEGRLTEVRWGAFPGVVWLTQLLDDLVLRANVRFGSDLLLFRKSLLTLEGLLADLAGELQFRTLLDQAVFASFLQHWAAEWPARLECPLASRAFGTHFSTADLLAFLCSGPATAARWWLQTAKDVWL